MAGERPLNGFEREGGHTNAKTIEKGVNAVDVRRILGSARFGIGG
jgi:hypothetical protein